MISPAEAERLIRSRVRPLPAERVALARAIGRVLSEAIHCTRDQPPFDRVTMDGIAIAASVRGQRTFRIAGTQPAGAPALTLASTDDCIEVMTGAIVPRGCDCVIPVERIEVRAGHAHLDPEANVTVGANIHARGLDCRQGDLLLERGAILGPAEVAVLAGNGYIDVPVSRQPSIMIISTGDELVEPGSRIENWQIYRSNAYGLLAALQRRGLAQLAADHLPDDARILHTRLAAHLREHDALILSGGVSMGRFDYVPQVLAELGVERVFHKVAQRPGKPMWFGLGREGQAVYALPGNPVSTLVCLARYVISGLAASQGCAGASVMHLPLSRDFEITPALALFLPVQLTRAEAVVSAEPRPTGGSGDFTALIGTDGFVELPPGPRVVRAGTAVPFYPW